MKKRNCGVQRACRIMNREGFSLIELMIAMVVLLIGLLGFFGLQLTAIQVNEANKRFIIAKETALQGVEEVKTMGYAALIKQSSDLIAKLGYFASLGSLPANYQMAGIDTSCGSPYTYCVYKGVTIQKTIQKGGVPLTVNYDHTLKLSVVVNYLTYPILQRCDMTVNWMSHGNPVKTTYVFFVEQKP